jgi:hypothetical protein
MSEPHAGGVATPLPDETVLVAGGSSASTATSAELYDPATGAWSAVGDAATPAGAARGILLGTGSVLVAGGSIALDTPPDTSTPSPSPSAMPSSTGTSTPTPTTSPTPTAPPSATSTATGAVPAGAWRPAASMSVATFGPRTLLADGRVLYGRSGSAQIYDPLTDTSSATGTGSSLYRLGAATLLPNGRVLAIGGIDANLGELYDPASGTWSVTTGATAHGFSTLSATLLKTGKVLFAGGGPSTATDLYDPATDTTAATGSLSIPETSNARTCCGTVASW